MRKPQNLLKRVTLTARLDVWKDLGMCSSPYPLACEFSKMSGFRRNQKSPCHRRQPPFNGFFCVLIEGIMWLHAKRQGWHRVMCHVFSSAEGRFQTKLALKESFKFYLVLQPRLLPNHSAPNLKSLSYF